MRLMKKFVLFMILASFLIACKKQSNCYECTLTDSSGFSSKAFPCNIDPATYQFKDINGNPLQAVCVKYE